MGRIAVFGPTSGIARAVCSEWLRRGRDLILIGREEGALRDLAADFKVRHGRDCPTHVWNMTDRDSHPARFRDLIASHDLDGMFFAPGLLLTEAEMEADPSKVRRLLEVNLTEPVVILNLFAAYFREKGAGFISVLSSVAGDRGRARNRTYGASKAGLTAFLEGLRLSLPPSLLIQIVKPGPVDTPMLAGYRGPGFLLASPATVARDIVGGIDRRKKTVYTPGYWRWIMAGVRSVPEFVLRRVPV